MFTIHINHLLVWNTTFPGKKSKHSFDENLLSPKFWFWKIFKISSLSESFHLPQEITHYKSWMDLLPFMGFDFNHKNSQGKIRFKFQNMFQGKSIQPSQTNTKLTFISGKLIQKIFQSFLSSYSWNSHGWIFQDLPIRVKGGVLSVKFQNSIYYKILWFQRFWSWRVYP